MDSGEGSDGERPVSSGELEQLRGATRSSFDGVNGDVNTWDQTVTGRRLDGRSAGRRRARRPGSVTVIRWPGPTRPSSDEVWPKRARPTWMDATPRSERRGRRSAGTRGVCRSRLRKWLLDLGTAPAGGYGATTTAARSGQSLQQPTFSGVRTSNSSDSPGLSWSS